MWDVTGRCDGFSMRCATSLLLTWMVFGAIDGNRQALAAHGQLKETRKLVSEEGTNGDQFGKTVALSGDLALVGAASGLVEGIDRCGSAFIFARDHGGPNQWGQVAKLVASDAASGDEFGFSVALLDDLALVGATKDDDHGKSSGSAYLFARNHGGVDKWGQIAKLTATDGCKNDHFGFFVGLSGDLAIVGAPLATQDETMCGVAYIFARNHGGPNRWGQVAKLTPSNPLPLAMFGGCVALSGDLALIGEEQGIEFLESGGSIASDVFYLTMGIPRIRPSQTELDRRSGAAYLFARDQGGPNHWGQVARLMPKDLARNSVFGAHVALSGDVAVVTATSDHGRKPRCGSAYVFSRHQGGPGKWGQVAKLTASDVDSESCRFGMSAALSCDRVLVGAMTFSPVSGSAGPRSPGAAYLFNRNHNGPNQWGQVAKLSASDATMADLLGRSVALSGQTALVGAHCLPDVINEKRLGSSYLFDLDNNALAADTQLKEARQLVPRKQVPEDHFGSVVALWDDQALVSAPTDLVKNNKCGSVHVFSRDHGGHNQWGQVARLVPDDPAAVDWFGCSVALSRNFALVGSYPDAKNGTLPGAAYVFAPVDKSAGKWRQVAKLTAEDGYAGDRFGSAIKLSGALAIVGAPTSDEDETRLGAAYVFARNQGGRDHWGQVAKLTPSDPRFLNDFGSAVALSDDLALVGASEIDLADRSGAAYLFARNQDGPNHWGQVAKLTPKDLTPGSHFGCSVSLSGDLAIVAAIGDDSKAPDAGAAYIFARNQNGPNRWGQVAKITASDGDVRDLFGFSVCLSKNMALVGTLGNFPWGRECGAAYLFYRNQGGADNWGEIAKLTATDGARNDRFGRSIALSDNVALVGAYQDGNLVTTERCGAAYLFQLEQLSPPRTPSDQKTCRINRKSNPDTMKE